MTIKPAKLRPPRHILDYSAGRETIVLPAMRNWFSLIFLGIWLAAWTFGGITAIVALLTQHETFIAIWLIGWAVGWVYAFTTIVWQLTGREVLWVEVGRLCHGWAAMGYSRIRTYESNQISYLSTDDSGSAFTPFAGRRSLLTSPFFIGRMGCIKFDYASRTIRMGSGIDEAEGRQIVARLIPGLPTTAAQQR